MKLVCIKCNRELIMKAVGIDVIETFSDKGDPYRIWSADAWQCPECGMQVAAGFGEIPRSSHHHPRFDRILDHSIQGPHVYMNDVPGGPVHQIDEWTGPIQRSDR